MFKQISFILLVSMFLCSCKEGFTKMQINTPYVSIEIDTIVLQTPKFCFEGLIFKDKYYIYTANKGMWLSVFDNRGILLNSSRLPDEIDRHWMLEYAAKNDSLFILNENHGMSTYHLDKQTGYLRLISETEMPVYEDEEYKILKTSHGEWGGMVYFIDKKTQEIYRAFSNEVINIIKFDNKYYVTNYLGHLIDFSSIYEIADPKKMQKFQGSMNDIVSNHAESSEQERYIFDGLKSIIDTVDVRIVGSFIHKNRLLQIWNEYISHKVYITEIVKENLECRYVFEFPMDIKYLYCYENKHFFNFNADDRKTFGVIEIDNDIIKVYIYKQENM